MNRMRCLEDVLKERVVFMDGAMGTSLQGLNLREEDFRGERFKKHNQDLKGNFDILSLTRPDLVKEVHGEFLNVGAQIISTNTFSANSISQADYGLESAVREMNLKAAALAREARREFLERNPQALGVWVVGAMGPTTKTASLSPDINRPELRSVDFDTLAKVYGEQAEALAEGGVDVFLVETIFDTLNARACIWALRRFFKSQGRAWPVMLSVTLSDASGRTLSGQSVEAFWVSVQHMRPLSVGINCALGAKAMRPFLRDLARVAGCYVSCYPNAGLPDPLSPTGYSEGPGDMAKELAAMGEEALLNIVGGCCGTTPEHVAELVRLLKNTPPRKIGKNIRPHSQGETDRESGEVIAQGGGTNDAHACRAAPGAAWWCGLDVVKLDKVLRPFVVVGERTNVTGSKKFARLVKSGQMEEALGVARVQVEAGAQVVDINFDEALLDAKACMQKYVRLLAAEPDIARVAFMFDSSRWEVCVEGLKNFQGKSIVNSISLKDGEEEFVKKAKDCLAFGASMVVMAFDEKGQAATFADKMRICKRAYGILREVGVEAGDIIFDPNILTLGTGMAQHNNYGVDFLNAVEGIKQECPGALVSGGVSNVSFSFRGFDALRKAINAVFLYWAVRKGLDMAIVNPEAVVAVSSIEPKLRQAIEDLIFNRDDAAGERLLNMAVSLKEEGAAKGPLRKKGLKFTGKNAAEFLKKAVVGGVVEGVKEAALSELESRGRALDVIEGPLMAGMQQVGNLFGKGEMFLPQVVKSARVMKTAVKVLEPHMGAVSEAAPHASALASALTVVLATVKGDVHDIGKNIVGIVLKCNGYEVVDLGVMVSCQRIMEVAKERGAGLVGLSGLITPSLDEMADNARAMHGAGWCVPLFIGGAATSSLHTAVKIAPEYGDGVVVRVADASRVVEAVQKYVKGDPKRLKANVVKLREEQKTLRDRFLNSRTTRDVVPLEEARVVSRELHAGEGAQRGGEEYWSKDYEPRVLGVRMLEPSLEEVVKFLDWSPLFWAWGLKGVYPRILQHARYGKEAAKLYASAGEYLQQIIAECVFDLKAVVGLWPAESEKESVYLKDLKGKVFEELKFLRQQKQKRTKGACYYCLSDFVASRACGVRDYVGAFAVTSGHGVRLRARVLEQKGDDYGALMVKVLGDRFAEAMAEWAHAEFRQKIWGYESQALGVEDLLKERYQGIRPAPGYPACPEHGLKRQIWKLLNVKQRIGVELTSSLAMHPASSVSGFYFGHPQAKYFAV